MTYIVNFRGGLGNQVVQARLGIALGLEQDNSSFSFTFNTAPPNSKLNSPQQPQRNYLNDIFSSDFKVSVNSRGMLKTRYWKHGSAGLLIKYRNEINKILPLRHELKPDIDAVVHVRSSDKCSSNDLVIFDHLVKRAIGYHSKVVIIGDNPHLINSLVSKYSVDGVSSNTNSSSALDDWYIALRAKTIYCTPSCFIFSAKTLEESKDIFVINPSDYTSYPHAMNEYLFLSELKKHLPGITFMKPILDTYGVSEVFNRTSVISYIQTTGSPNIHLSSASLQNFLASSLSLVSDSIKNSFFSQELTDFNLMDEHLLPVAQSLRNIKEN